MICEECKAEGRTSTVQSYGCSSALVSCHPWYDEEGTYHSHNSNRVTSGYGCSNGHIWTIVTNSRPCPAPGCSFGRGEND